MRVVSLWLPITRNRYRRTPSRIRRLKTRTLSTNPIRSTMTPVGLLRKLLVTALLIRGQALQLIRPLWQVIRELCRDTSGVTLVESMLCNEPRKKCTIDAPRDIMTRRDR
jgi:hypothetical protein